MRLNVGDRVEWSTEKGIIKGTVKEKKNVLSNDGMNYRVQWDDDGSLCWINKVFEKVVRKIPKD